jgi:hypothetical protein
MTRVSTMKAPQPAIGEWYRMTDSDKQFEVVAVDDDDGTIEIQYFDGTVEELDREDWDVQWADGEIESSQEPEDWTGSVDVESGDINEDSDKPAGSSIESQELP